MASVPPSLMSGSKPSSRKKSSAAPKKPTVSGKKCRICGKISLPLQVAV